MSTTFRHRDGAATIVFGPDALQVARDLIGDGYVLLSTERARRSAPTVAAGAARTIDVPPGPVDEIAAGLREQVGDAPLVALGGGRVVDAAKAVAAANGTPGPVAIPTSLSGAEMTGVHRHARGVDDATPRSRARVVVNDPALSASQPVAALAASSANALGHAVTALVSDRSTPIARPVALDAIARTGRAWSSTDPDRHELALAALLAGWAVDRSGLGPHHALSQTAVRLAGLGHAQVNAALLPETVAAVRRRVPEALTPADGVLGAPLETLAETLRDQAGGDPLAVLRTDPDLLERVVAAAAARGELGRVPPAVDADEVRRIYLAAA